MTGVLNWRLSVRYCFFNKRDLKFFIFSISALLLYKDFYNVSDVYLANSFGVSQLKKLIYSLEAHFAFKSLFLLEGADYSCRLMLVETKLAYYYV